jgi:hypothetical protein
VPHNDFENQLLMGWTLEQWAVAIDRVGMGGTMMQYADKTRKEYLSRYGQNPLEYLIIGARPAGNYDLAAALFEQLEGGLERCADSDPLDSSYGDQTKDDMDYEEGFKNRYRH